MLHAIVHTLTKGLVFKRHLSETFGRAPVYVSSDAYLKLLGPMSRIEPVLFRLAKTFMKPGNVVWDVGANVGLFTFACAHLAGLSGHVVAFEPDTWLVQLLRRSARIQNGGSTITIVPAAAAQVCGLRTFCIAKNGRAANFLSGYGYGASITGGVREEMTVVAVTLDSILNEKLPPPTSSKN